MKITKTEIIALLKEDRASQDITTNSIIVQNKVHHFQIISKSTQLFVLFGQVVARAMIIPISS